MSASTLEHTARSRRSRTRSRTVNARPALALSTLKPHQYDLHPDCVSLVCPDCKTWVPITGIKTRKPKIVPHDTGRAGKDAAVRCRLGSNRLVNIDVTVRLWQQRLEEGHAETGRRRPTSVLRKPQAAAAPAVAGLVIRRLLLLRSDLADGRPLWLLREMKWASTASSVRDADTRRAQLPDGDAPLGAPPVPRKTLRPECRAS